MALDLGKFLTEIRSHAAKEPIFARMALMLEQIEQAVNQQGSMTGVDVSGHTTPPDPPASLDVKASAGNVHVSLTDSSQRSRPLDYYVECSTDPSFPDGNTHIENLGPSRSKFFALPGKDDNGAAQPWHFRTYSMNLGSQQRSAHLTFGGATSPTAVTVGGTAQLTPLPTTGSGTTTQAGQGRGTAQFSKP